MKDYLQTVVLVRLSVLFERAVDTLVAAFLLWSLLPLATSWALAPSLLACVAGVAAVNVVVYPLADAASGKSWA